MPGRQSFERRLVMFLLPFLPVNPQMAHTNLQPQDRQLKLGRKPSLKSSLIGAAVARTLLEKQLLAL
jgi:hypothetical protein